MDTRQIREILKGNFSDPRDRKYWEAALKEAERKERNSKELEKMYPAAKNWSWRKNNARNDAALFLG